MECPTPVSRRSRIGRVPPVEACSSAHILRRWQERPGFRLIQEKVKVPYLDLGCEVRPEIRENAEGQILCSVCFERDQEQDGNELSQDVKSAPATVHTALLSLPTGAAK